MFLAIARAPSPAASECRTSRVNVGKTVRLENQDLSHHDDRAIKATRRLRVISVIDREKLGARCGAGRSRRARAPPRTRTKAANAVMPADRMNGEATPSRSMAKPPAIDPTRRP